MDEGKFFLFMELTMDDFMYHVGIYLESATQYSHMSYYSPKTKSNLILYYDDQRDNIPMLVSVVMRILSEVSYLRPIYVC